MNVGITTMMLLCLLLPSLFSSPLVPVSYSQWCTVTAQQQERRTIALNCIPFNPILSGFILNRYSSSPPHLSMVLSAPAVTLSLSLSPNDSE